MSNWKIGWRITAGFASVILIAVCLGVFAYRATVGIQLNGQALTNDFLPSSASLSHIQADSFRKTNLLLLHSRSSSQREMDELEERMKALTEDANASLAAYDRTESTPEEKVLYEKVKAARTQFLATFEEVRKLSRVATPAANKRAGELIAEALVPQLEAYSSATQVLLDYDMKSSLDGLKQVNGAVDSAKNGIVLGLVLATVLAALVTFYIVRSITSPLALAVNTLRRVAECDMTARLDVHTADEIGEMASALNSAVDRLRGTLQEVASSARSANTSSRELASAADSIATGAQEQAASLEETSASLEEITATVRQSADNARHANQLATASKEAAQLGMAVVTDAVEAMREINVASSQIAQIIATIDEIAFQTNLLAVNAAVEAARAGDQGRGFAVVASEVRSLAQRSAGAAKEIKTLIQDSLGKVQRGSELVNRSGTTLDSIIGSVQRVTDIVGEISSAAAEQTTGIEQVSTAVLQIDQVTQANSSQTEELAATANALSDQSLHLTGLVEVFRLGDASRAEHAAVHATVPVREKVASSAAVRVGKKTRMQRPLVAATRLQPVGAAADGGSFVEF